MSQRTPGWFDAIDGWNPYDPSSLRPRDIAPVQVSESPIRRLAAFWFLGFFFVFLAWSILAPIDAGVSVQGNVNVLGNRKAVQHPAGGVVQSIEVKEGAVVKEGDVLLRINPLRTDAELTSVQLQYINLLATESRLKAEQNDFGAIDWSEFWNVVGGNGPCNKERLATRVKAWNDGQWLRDAALAHAHKQTARTMQEAA